jgi:hypothetical protein
MTGPVSDRSHIVVTKVGMAVTSKTSNLMMSRCPVTSIGMDFDPVDGPAPDSVRGLFGL